MGRFSKIDFAALAAESAASMHDAPLPRMSRAQADSKRAGDALHMRLERELGGDAMDVDGGAPSADAPAEGADAAAVVAFRLTRSVSAAAGGGGCFC